MQAFFFFFPHCSRQLTLNLQLSGHKLWALYVQTDSMHPVLLSCDVVLAKWLSTLCTIKHFQVWNKSSRQLLFSCVEKNSYYKFPLPKKKKKKDLSVFMLDCLDLGFREMWPATETSHSGSVFLSLAWLCAKPFMSGHAMPSLTGTV